MANHSPLLPGGFIFGDTHVPEGPVEVVAFALQEERSVGPSRRHIQHEPEYGGREDRSPAVSFSLGAPITPAIPSAFNLPPLCAESAPLITVQRVDEPISHHHAEPSLNDKLYTTAIEVQVGPQRPRPVPVTEIVEDASIGIVGVETIHSPAVCEAVLPSAPSSIPSPSVASPGALVPKMYAEGPAPSLRRPTPMAGPTTVARQSLLKPWAKDILSIVLIGETGAGKTAFISFLINACRGVGIERYVQNVSSGISNGNVPQESTTQGPEIITIHCPDNPGKIIRILDTPGLADWDKTQADNIAEMVKTQFETVDAVLVIGHGTAERFKSTVESTFRAIQGSFPTSISNNVGIVFTHIGSKDELEFNLNFSSLVHPLAAAPFWVLQNPIGIWRSANEKRRVAPYMTKVQHDRLSRYLVGVHSEGIEVLNEILEWLDKRTVAQYTAQVYDLRDSVDFVESEITNTLSKLGELEQKRTEFVVLQTRLERREPVTSINMEFQRIVTRMEWSMKPTLRHNTVCISPECHSNCHIDCGLVFTLDVEFVGNNCSAFCGQRRDGTSTICAQCGHLARHHRHLFKKWVQDTVSELTTDHQIQMNVHWNFKSEYEKIRLMNNNLRTTIERVDDLRRDGQKKIEELCVVYNGLAITGGFSGYLASLLELLKMRYEARRRANAEKDEMDMLHRSIEQLGAKHDLITATVRSYESEESVQKPRSTLFQI